MKNYIRYIIIGFICFNIEIGLFAQHVNTTYFMKNISERHEYNPAFQPISNFYLDLPAFPNLKMEVGNNSLSIKDIFETKNIDGQQQLITALHPQGDRDKLLKNIRPKMRIFADFSINLLDFGFRIKEKNYFTFGISQKVFAESVIPKDIFTLLIKGNGDGREFNLRSLGIDATTYTEFALGYSRIINEQWTVGGKFKYLMGQANVSTHFKDFDLYAGIDKWELEGNGEIRTSIPYMTIPKNEDGSLNFEGINFESFSTDNITNTIFTTNWGLGLDLGATYKPLENLELSASFTDIGFIHWRKNNYRVSTDGEFEFEGIPYSVNDNIEENLEQIGDNFLNAFTVEHKNKSYVTALRTRMNIGAEYSVVNDKIGFGLLSSTLFTNKYVSSDLTTSVNFRPCKFFSSSFSYSLADGNWSTIGFGAQMCLGIFNMYLVVDHIPLAFTQQKIPSRYEHASIEMGWTWTIGNMYDKDDDEDGVRNRKDLCPETPFGYLVDKQGCTVDEDKDGVADNVDQCPNTPENVMVDSLGCPIDSDKDGVADYLDQCPNTPENVQVDTLGCPLDKDGDGVADYLDKCPGTPKEAYGKVDSIGCPLDSDKDGVADYMDKCMNTPIGVPVDSVGCPFDEDKDGVADYLDKCPGTPKEAYGKINAEGCPIDSDNDGIADYEDYCPMVPGVKTNRGCPEIKIEAKRIFEQALQGIQFQSGKDIILKSSYSILDKVAKILLENEDYNIDINGHTDNQGNAENNQRLSEKRAEAVRKYLSKKGVEEDRMKAYGFGDTKPIADNKTAKGRKQNRRVEFIVRFKR
ncbi:MAG: OmpA family protein [Paludibacteraceae bacterium]|nr:OmpA family protein [Paludibacteraceae bacterium]